MIESSPNDNGLGTKVERWLALDVINAGQVIGITREQAANLAKLDPCFRESHLE